MRDKNKFSFFHVATPGKKSVILFIVRIEGEHAFFS